MRGGAGARRVKNDGVDPVEFARIKRRAGEIGFAADHLCAAPGKVGGLAKRVQRRPVHFDSGQLRQAGQERQAERAAAGIEVGNPCGAVKKAANILLQCRFRLAGGLKKGARRRGHGDIAETQHRR